MKKVNSEIFLEFNKVMPDMETIAKLGMDSVLGKVWDSKKYLKENFSGIVQNIGDEGYRIFKEHEQKIGEKVIRDYLGKKQDEDIFHGLNDFFMSLSQSRKARAGKTFETIIRTLFKNLDYPFEEQCVINGKPDFLLPSKAHYNNNAPDCIIFTAKRTLRERWRQIATEGVRGKGLFLATIDELVSKQQAKEMLDNRIYLVVPQKIKNDIKSYADAPNILSFEDFFTDHLDPAMARWKRAGIL